jgi:hypothetical protein
LFNLFDGAELFLVVLAGIPEVLADQQEIRPEGSDAWQMNANMSALVSLHNYGGKNYMNFQSFASHGDGKRNLPVSQHFRL